MGTKRAFYPTDRVDHYLEKIPKGQLSARVSELILKGLAFEKEKKIQQAYAKYNEEVSGEKRKKNKNGISPTMMMSAKAFEPEEDEVEDFI